MRPHILGAFFMDRRGLVGSLFFDSGKYGKKRTRSNSVPQADAESVEKTGLIQALELFLSSAISVSRVSRANGRESVRVLPVSRFSRVFIGAKLISRIIINNKSLCRDNPQAI